MSNHGSRPWRWTEQFRQLLDEHHFDVCEMKSVIAALKLYRSEMKPKRYLAPEDLHRDAAEWVTVRYRIRPAA